MAAKVRGDGKDYVTPDLYKILQVDPEADAEVIEAAYRRLARRYHPDISTEPDAERVLDRLSVGITRDTEHLVVVTRDGHGRPAAAPCGPGPRGSGPWPGGGPAPAMRAGVPACPPGQPSVWRIPDAC